MTSPVFAQDLARRLHDTHDQFKETTLKERRFKQADILPLIEQLKARSQYQVSVVGQSFEGRSISMIKLGKGKTTVLLWSQMHGDEPTATMAIFDMFNFFNQSGDEFDALRKQILDNTTLYFVPMLNPDGAEVYKRRTALDIDMNRDALRLQTPEGRLLKQLQNTLKPTFGFNLHDQSPRYSAGPTGHLATISFLATAYDFARSLNDVRRRSMQLIINMNRELQKFIPNQVARYSDEHEPRAFGDNIQKWGTSLVLIESGGYKNDPEKMYIRKLNYVAILSGLQAIATNTLVKEDIAAYEKIPENGRSIFDLLIRNATVQRNGQSIKMDVGINRNELPMNLPPKWFVKGVVEDMGDLSTFFGTDELDATGLILETTEDLRMGLKADFTLKKDGQVVYTIKNGVLTKGN
ncbi:MAG: M14 family zinc carboxypeptidase [Spirosomataceae bacterium]